MISTTHIFETLGVTRNTLKSWRSRGKIEYSGSLVDLELPINKDFFYFQCEKLGIEFSVLSDESVALPVGAKPKEVKSPPKVKVETKKEVEQKDTQLIITDMGDFTGDVSGMVKRVMEDGNVNTRKQATDVVKNEIAARKDAIELKKKEGRYIEVESAVLIMQKVVTEFNGGNREDFKLLINLICEEHGIPHSHLVKYQKSVDDNMNKRAETVKTVQEAEVYKSIDEVRDKLSRGERQSR
jgi:hypothetical protein